MRQNPENLVIGPRILTEELELFILRVVPVRGSGLGDRISCSTRHVGEMMLLVILCSNGVTKSLLQVLCHYSNGAKYEPTL